MIKDSRHIAELYFEDVTTASNLTLPVNAGANSAAADKAATIAPAPVTGNIVARRAASAYGEAEEKKLPAKHWVKVERVVKDDVREIDNLAHEIATLIHTCCHDHGVTSKVMSKVLKKHRAWTRR